MHGMTEFVEAKMGILPQLAMFVKRIFFKKATNLVATGQKVIV